YLFKDFSFNSSVGSSPDTITVELSPIRQGASLVLKNIYFDTDSYLLDERSVSEIQTIAEVMRDNPYMQIEISGHTDDIGTKPYNQLLSENRARSVFESLRKEGIAAERVQYVGFGDSRPLVSNDSKKNRQSNRRIEFRVLRTKQ
ncbi:MAG: OmpA family protein, partial [Bacteroidota bacterium]